MADGARGRVLGDVMGFAGTGIALALLVGLVIMLIALAACALCVSFVVWQVRRLSDSGKKE